MYFVLRPWVVAKYSRVLDALFYGALRGGSFDIVVDW